MTKSGKAGLLLASALALSSLPAAVLAQPVTPQVAEKVSLSWGTKIPLRDAVNLNATVYRPKGETQPRPCIVHMTPYIADTYHERGMYFAANGFPFFIVDVRGRGNSEGVFRPMIQEVDDGYDVIEWVARQPFCNGKVSMWGGSYAGFNQWAAAKNKPPHLATIVPVASAHAGTDFPFRNNIAYNYMVQWLTYTAGKASQTSMFSDSALWNGLWKDRFKKGLPHNGIETVLGSEHPMLRQWIANPEAGGHYDAYGPVGKEFAALDFPILTITGSYDDDQPGALAFYNDHLKYASTDHSSKHFLVIGPWDHLGTRTPKPSFSGLTVGPASLVDLPRLHVDWYNWTMNDGPRPAFLKKRVAYYVMGKEEWRHADSLAAVTRKVEPYYLDSAVNATSLLASGQLNPEKVGRGKPDQYVYDPRDTSLADVEASLSPDFITDQTMVIARDGKQLVYHTAPFDKPTQVAGFFKLSAWIAIDQPDTDFQVAVYEITKNGDSILLTTDLQRARYRESHREPKLIDTQKPLLYTFERFTFTARQIAQGSRLRLVIAPINSIHLQKNYNAAKRVSDQSMADARTVTVRLLHDQQHPSALHIPFGHEKAE